jgi:hypothetical protein
MCGEVKTAASAHSPADDVTINYRTGAQVNEK